MNRRRSTADASSRLAPRVLRTDDIPAKLLDPNAVHVVERLQRCGHAAYLVGGCVRDLLLKRKPKDFDVATSARPRQIRRVFRNCRIIGRRFKLAHVVFGDDVIETSTFRTIPSASAGVDVDAGDLLITSDNEFGTAVEDAQRRDFTVNALFYDPAKREVIDYVGGLADLEQGLIRTVGDPQIRFREDPVRILRAIKFASRLDFRFEPETFRAMRDCAFDLEKGAPPRVLEEILRLLRSGKAENAFRLLDESGSLAVILPEIHVFLGASRAARDGEDNVLFGYLQQLDRRFAAGADPSAGLCLAVLFECLLTNEIERREREARGPQDLLLVLDDVMADFAERTRLSRRDSGSARRIALLKHRLARRGRRRQRPTALVRQEGFDDALDLLAIECTVRGRATDRELYLQWHERRISLVREGGLDDFDPTRRERLLHAAIPAEPAPAPPSAPPKAAPAVASTPVRAVASAPARTVESAPVRAVESAPVRAVASGPVLRIVAKPVERRAKPTPRAPSLEVVADAAPPPAGAATNPNGTDELPFGYGIFEEPEAPRARVRRSAVRKRR